MSLALSLLKSLYDKKDSIIIRLTEIRKAYIIMYINFTKGEYGIIIL